MKTSPTRKQGFTLVEMTVAIIFGLVIASTGTLLLNQQVGIIRRVNQQSFILRDAPEINQILTSILAKSDAIRLHNNFADALGDSNPVTANGQALVAAFRQPDGTTTFGIIDFGTTNAGVQGLHYYRLGPGATPTAGSPDWTISRNVNAVDFNLVNGLFQLTLTGPAAETITYTISPNQ